MGGRLVVQAPDARQTMRALLQEGDYLCNRCGARMFGVIDLEGFEENFVECVSCGQSADSISEAAVGRFYGGQDYIGNFHLTCFTSQSLTRQVESSGFKLVLREDLDDHYIKNWTLRQTFEKVDIWR